MLSAKSVILPSNRVENVSRGSIFLPAIIQPLFSSTFMGCTVEITRQCKADVLGAAGNMGFPDKLLHSFKVCGISVETDATEDGLVHCISLEGWQLIPQQRYRPRQLCSLLANNTAQYSM